MIAPRPSMLRPLGALVLSVALCSSCRLSVSAGSTPPSAEPEDARRAPTPTAPQIDGARMFADLETLADDALNGRFTFSDTLGAAADHIAAQYRAAGLGPVGEGYRVPFTMPFGSAPGQRLVLWVEDNGGTSKQVAGDRFTSLCNAAGKAAYAEAIAIRSLESPPAAVRGKVVVAASPPAAEVPEAVARFARHEPAALVLVGEGPAPSPDKAREKLDALRFPAVWIDAAAAKQWMGITAQGRDGPRLPGPTKLSVAAKQEPVMRPSFNVLAVLPGQDKPEEIVMLGAHYDHIGTAAEGMMCQAKGEDSICNGADDNASGTAMVLEVARALAESHYRPARTIVFAHFAAEELGLHGSRALAEKPPRVAPFKDGRVVAMLNLDMVGRLNPDKGLAIGGLSSSDQWMPLLDEVGAQGLPIVYERAINGRSDHANFYRKKIPVLFFFTGLHDDYHGVGDHLDKINRGGMDAIARLVAGLVVRLADGAPIAYAAPRTDDEGEVMRMPGSRESSVEKRIPAAAAKPSG